MKYKNEPKQPVEWGFVNELKSPIERIFNWNRNEPTAGEADLSGGIEILPGFPDNRKLLETAYKDLWGFFREARIKTGGYKIITVEKQGMEFESYQIEIDKKECRILASDSEGIRRGIYYLEDLLLDNDGPFLKLGKIEKKTWIKTRISRCFFGPIKRPPFNRDELMDDIDYYPDEYLNKLAHEGVNVLWLTIEFKDLCRTSVIPEYGCDAEKRLAKLRKTVDKCLRYGIKTYIFCIEPAAWNIDDPILLRHPELGGAKKGDVIYFCPFSDISQKYLYESVYSIFKAVPDLGGMINISHGERSTTCLSSIESSEAKSVDCPICSGKENWEILHASLSAMERGMRDAAPDAHLISWLYAPRTGKWADWYYEIAKHTPENVTLQFNFESGGELEHLGKTHIGGDYWLSYVGPAERFKRIAESAISSGIQMSAKIQVGCSHEIATIPFIPVPSLLYHKYREMHKLGVSHVMQCWYFGNYPGSMNKAAGMLAFEDFSDNEKDFLFRLARPDWGESSGEVVKAWEIFADAYSNYPFTMIFQSYGPMHDGVVWPLHLFPAWMPLAPTWLLDSGTSGDCIGECLGDYSIEEAMELCRRMSEKWNEGVAIMKNLRKDFSGNSARLKDIALADAIGLQFSSGYGILCFYALREKLFKDSDDSKNDILDQMEAIVLKEIGISKRMIELCENDSRLGFHSEAEGYKYFPEKLTWRIGTLELLLREDFPKARNNPLPVPVDTDEIYNCNSDVCEDCEAFTWKASNDDKFLTLELECPNRGNPDQFFIDVMFRESSLMTMFLYKSGYTDSNKPGCSCHISETSNGWKAEVKIPMEGNDKTARFSIIRIKNNKEIAGWGGKPLKYRVRLSIYNPKEMGLLNLSR